MILFTLFGHLIERENMFQSSSWKTRIISWIPSKKKLSKLTIETLEQGVKYVQSQQ